MAVLNAKRSFVLLIVAAAILLLPAAWNIYVSTGPGDWKSSQRFNGQNYLVSSASYVEAQNDATGVAASLATLATWNGLPTGENDVVNHLDEAGYTGNLADFTAMASHYGFAGQWLQTEAGAITQLNVPFIAHMSDGGGRVVIVRDARSGYVYATDPSRGNVLYPVDSFVESWTGQVFAFPAPPDQPEEWR